MRTRMHAWTCARAGTFRDAYAQTNFGMRTLTIENFMENFSKF
jgi:hypothetical protein